ncbi:hypothetical protein GVAV_000445 [Gurleya vavrai]
MLRRESKMFVSKRKGKSEIKSKQNIINSKTKNVKERYLIVFPNQRREIHKRKVVDDIERRIYEFGRFEGDLDLYNLLCRVTNEEFDVFDYEFGN